MVDDFASGVGALFGAIGRLRVGQSNVVGPDRVKEAGGGRSSISGYDRPKGKQDERV